MKSPHCNWCGAVPHPIELLTVMERYGRLCPGCYYCWKHGTPRPLDDGEEQPFTDEQRRIAAWSKDFFAKAIELRTT